MITVATTSDEEAETMVRLLRHGTSGLDYRVFLLGSQVASRVADELALDRETRLPDIGLPHPANREAPGGQA